MADERRVVLPRYIEKMGTRDLTKSLTKIHKSVERADWHTQERDMFFKMFSDPFERQVMATREDHCRFFRSGEDDFLQQQRIRFGAIELFGHLAGLADFAHLDQVRRFKRKDVMPNPRGRLLH